MWSASVQAPSSAGGGRADSPLGWNSDDERDYEDQQYSPPSPMAYYPGSRNPLARFMADLPNVKTSTDIVYDIVHDIVYDIVYDIVHDIVYDIVSSHIAYDIVYDIVSRN